MEIHDIVNEADIQKLEVLIGQPQVSFEFNERTQISSDQKT